MLNSLLDLCPEFSWERNINLIVRGEPPQQTDRKIQFPHIKRLGSKYYGEPQFGAAADYQRCPAVQSGLGRTNQVAHQTFYRNLKIELSRDGAAELLYQKRRAMEIGF